MNISYFNSLILLYSSEKMGLAFVGNLYECIYKNRGS